MKKILTTLFVLAMIMFCACEQNIPNIEGSRTLKIGGLEYEMALIQSNSFDMGATAEQGVMADFNEEYPVHHVQLNSYYIGVSEVTQGLWRSVMGDSMLTSECQVLGLGDNMPVHNISWDDANRFIVKISKLTGENFSLPTEAEWEYAARGGVQNNVFSGSSALDVVGWNGYESVVNVKSKASNNFGLFDMSGNVAEYCMDWYGAYSQCNQIMPVGPETGTMKVVRGGSISSDASECRVSARRRELPSDKVPDCGFRLVIR